MRLFVRTTLAAALLAACHTAPAASAPSPATAPAVVASPAGPARSTSFIIARTPRLAETHASLSGQSRANGTRTALIVAAIAAAAVIVILVAGGGSGNVY